MKVILILFCLFLLVSCTNRHYDVLQGYIEGEYTHLSSPLAGKLQRLYVHRGQTVTAGQRMFDLDPEPEASQVQRANATLLSEKSKLKDYLSGQRTSVLAGIIAQREQARADLELAQNNFNRTQQLFQKGVVSRAAYDQSLATLKANQQKLNQFEQNLREAEQGERQFRILQQTDVVQASEADLTEAKWRLAQKSVITPTSGLIFDTFFNEGEQIAADQPVASLLSPRYIWLIFYVPEPIRSKIYLNQRVEFTCDGCTKRYYAIINYISPQAEFTPPVIFSRESRTKLVYRVQAALPLNVATLVHPGQPVEVYLLPPTVKKEGWGAKLWNRLRK